LVFYLITPGVGETNPAISSEQRKLRMAARSKSQSGTDTKQMVNAAVREIRKAHTQAKKIFKKYGHDANFGEGRLAEEANALSVNQDTIRKLRLFGDPKKGYSENDLTKLCKLCEEHQRALGLTHVFKLVSVPKKGGQRRRIQRELFEQGWSKGQLDNEILARFGRRKAGGKKPAIADSPAGVLAQIDGICFQLTRFVNELRSPEGASSLASLSPEIQGQLVSVSAVVDQLRGSIETELQRLRVP